MIEPVDEASLDDLRARLRATRFVPPVADQPWQDGVDRDYVRGLVAYWADGFDWRAVERRLAALPWVRTSNGLTAVHQRCVNKSAPAVVLLHGWPDSFLRYERVLPLLDDVHVVVPCLPGYPYSGTAGADQPTIAGRLAEAMRELGYHRYVVSGGDIGAQVAEAWARDRPGSIAALHLSDVPFRHVLALDERELSGPERAFRNRIGKWQAEEGAYAQLQSTKPDTLSVGLGDSPTGLAAWIVEKLRSWSDCGGDVETVFTRDDLLTWITIHWVTATIGTSFTPYARRPDPRPGRVEVPTVVTAFPADPLTGPREFAERIFDLRAWATPHAGGHFGAWEQPEEFVRGLRAAINLR